MEHMFYIPVNKMQNIREHPSSSNVKKTNGFACNENMTGHILSYSIQNIVLQATEYAIYITENIFTASADKFYFVLSELFIPCG